VVLLRCHDEIGSIEQFGLIHQPGVFEGEACRI
jgi:hypothetical protein